MSKKFPVRHPPKRWSQCGWLIKTGRATQYQLRLPAGASARISFICDRKMVNGHEEEIERGWVFSTGKWVYEEWSEKEREIFYPTARDAAIAAEVLLRSELGLGLKLLEVLK